MDNPWRNEFRRRMSMFDEHAHGDDDDDGLAVSMKVRVTSGCFHREHSPQAYRLIDEYLQLHALEDVRWSFQEHESGPELLLYLAVTTAGLSLAAGIINLVTAIIKARADGIKKGDHPELRLSKSSSVGTTGTANSTKNRFSVSIRGRLWRVK